MEMLSTKQKTAIIIAGVIVVGIFMIYMVTKTKSYDYTIINEAVEENISKENEEEVKAEGEKEEMIIHITGAVKNQGIVKLEEGARIVDAIEAAGGPTNEANVLEINLAQILKDGQKVYIPKFSDTKEQIEESNSSETSAIIDSGEAEDSNGKININTANISKLTELPGIGETTAIKIKTYRDINGKFKSIEEIKNVSGIGGAKYENIKDYICVK